MTDTTYRLARHDTLACLKNAKTLCANPGTALGGARGGEVPLVNIWRIHGTQTYVTIIIVMPYLSPSGKPRPPPHHLAEGEAEGAAVPDAPRRVR